VLILVIPEPADNMTDSRYRAVVDNIGYGIGNDHGHEAIVTVLYVPRQGPGSFPATPTAWRTPPLAQTPSQHGQDATGPGATRSSPSGAYGGTDG
jgi:hypothetical protein